MHRSPLRLSIALLVLATLYVSGCGEADHQATHKSAEALSEEVKLSNAPQEDEIRKNEERIKTLRAENEALQKQLEATQKTAEAAPAKP